MRTLKEFTRKILLGSLLLTMASGLTAQEPPKILSSIKPLQLIAQAVTDGIAPVDVLLPPGASPHSHSLRPSDARRLNEADVVFWVGPDMETFLPRMLAGAKQAVSVPLMNTGQLQLLKSGSNEQHDHDHGHHDHDHGEYDAHIWLSPRNALAMAETMVETLSRVDKANQKQYEQNLAKFRARMNEADEKNRKRLAPVSEKPIFVFHDAYNYIQQHYDLNIAGYFTLNPEQPPGARHLTQLREKLRSSGKTCVFREPQFAPAYVDRITQDLPVKVAVLDPLAMDIVEGADSYVQFINGIVDSITDCLM
ncbi:MAG: zinc ABC transporter substrate-binding protein ZnuA [Endozoicomonas sp.]